MFAFNESIFCRIAEGATLAVTLGASFSGAGFLTSVFVVSAFLLLRLSGFELRRFRCEDELDIEEDEDDEDEELEDERRDLL